MEPKMTSYSKREQNVPSSLISREENQKIFRVLGKQCTTLSTTVVLLYVKKESWQMIHCGVICFVKDYNQQSYFLRLFDMEKFSWIWEQKLNHRFVYKPVSTFFHVFEADHGIAGLYFIDNLEADHFESIVQMKLLLRAMRGRERRIARRGALLSNTGNATACNWTKSEFSENGHCRRKKRNVDFSFNIHLQNVDFNSERPFSVESIDPRLKAFFDLAGVTDEHLKDGKTRKFILKFIARNGGLERVKQEVQSKSQATLANGKDERTLRTKEEKFGCQPLNFTHWQRTVWHPENGFEVEDVDIELEAFFKSLGISDKNSKDIEEQDFIDEFIAKIGGLKRPKQGLESVPQRDVTHRTRSTRSAWERPSVPPTSTL